MDTWAWVEYLRATGSATDRMLTELLGEQAELATTDVVLMELLAGARTDAERDDLRRRADAELLHRDADFDAIARHSPLQIA